MAAAVRAERSKRGKTARRRGHETELMVTSYLRKQGYEDAETTRAKLGHSGTKQPGDISFHALVCLEVKGVKKPAWPSWCRQAASEAREGMVPVVVHRTPGVTDVGAWECRVEVHGWFGATAMGGCIYHPLGGISEVDDQYWNAVTFAEFVAALRRCAGVPGDDLFTYTNEETT